MNSVYLGYITRIILITLCWQSIVALPTIHVFGDSHSVFCFGKEAILNTHYSTSFEYNGHTLRIVIHHLGPKTMHGIGKAVLELRHYGIGKGDILIFVCGEIDARCHIAKQASLQNTTTDAIIDSLLDNYCTTIESIASSYDTTVCMAMEVLPPCDQVYNPECPRYGSLEERIRITQALNKKLKQACDKKNIVCFQVYDLYADDDGSFNLSLSDGYVHVALNQNYRIKERLMALLFDNGLLD